MDYGEEANAEADQQAENLYSNNHDLIGVEGIVRAQKNEIEKKKVGRAYINNELCHIAWTQNREWKVLQIASRDKLFIRVVRP